MENNYKLKYLKYKLKYNNLKNQIGGNIIYHFQRKPSPIAMAEAITYGSLKENMTQHGMGTGIYGFINPDTEAAKLYNNSSHYSEKFRLENPIILKNTYLGEYGEKITDLNIFSTLSTGLNTLCAILYENKGKEKGLITRDNVKNILEENHLYQNENSTYDGIPNTTITLDEIVFIVLVFMTDYESLMQTNKDDEDYVLLPINYLAYLKNFDGVLNMIDDSGRVGSIKYVFDSSYGARGYLAPFKREALLKGKLIFSEHI
jgi:hypothetical protein